MLPDSMIHHLPDRVGFALTALDISGLEPVEAALRIVGLLLFRIEQDEAIAIGERRPARAVIVSGGRLRASMQDDDKSRRGRKSFRSVSQHPEIPGVGSEACDFRQPARCRLGLECRGCGARGLHHCFPLAAVVSQLANHLP